MKRFALALVLAVAAAPAFAFSVDMSMPNLFFPSDATTTLSTSGK
ncbi:MAG: hypothetical protein ACRC6I_21040 [Paracoccaceae bacterium]